ncbi:hypothetical protein N7532_010334 [Penicillium argentinense]|uniref:TLC domain-containing protein n=1 Tax=Penicillium argentinense TaxID=1131581 RepID=A0A9W9EPE5_9EURO|nr:uncharacterized protein N7532_010334 [Penicillium argentinense]KAJ5085563.1 hypothetical protein N7532_010334 [Penicillium argentinense]
MEQLYTVVCHGQPDYTQCIPLVKAATFAPSYLLLLTTLCALLNHYTFSPRHLSKIYGAKYVSLTRKEQRRVGSLHVGLVMKTFAFIFMGTPAYLHTVGGYTWSDPAWIPGPTLGDMCTVSVMAFGALGIFDLIYDEHLGLVYLVHHMAMLACIPGFFAALMTLPLPLSPASLVRLGVYCQVSLTWVLFSSLGSSIAHLTYLLHQFRPKGPKGFRQIHKAFLAGFVAFTILLSFEAGAMAYSILRFWNQLPTATPLLLCLLQVLFTATKLKTARNIWTVYRRQVHALRAQVQRELTPPPTIGSEDEKICASFIMAEKQGFLGLEL